MNVTEQITVSFSSPLKSTPYHCMVYVYVLIDQTTVYLELLAADDILILSIMM